MSQTFRHIYIRGLFFGLRLTYIAKATNALSLAIADLQGRSRLLWTRPMSFYNYICLIGCPLGFIYIRLRAALRACYLCSALYTVLRTRPLGCPMGFEP
jgi:hypothetical protein